VKIPKCLLGMVEAIRIHVRSNSLMHLKVSSEVHPADSIERSVGMEAR